MSNFLSEVKYEMGRSHEGQNFILDKGIPFEIYAAYLHELSEYIQLIKLGWTTWSLMGDKNFRSKIELADTKQIPICLGGTLFEISYSLGRYNGLLDFLVDSGIKSIEVASGFSVEPQEIPAAIEVAKKRGLIVMAEIGRKNQAEDDALTVEDRLLEIYQARDSGADFIILEAREAGAGYSVFKENESNNASLLEGILKTIPLENIVFEAPQRDNQIHLVNTLGPNVIMGNIPYDEIPRVETIRRGLHADTFKKSR